jgi:hypothetical protein
MATKVQLNISKSDRESQLIINTLGEKYWKASFRLLDYVEERNSVMPPVIMVPLIPLMILAEGNENDPPLMYEESRNSLLLQIKKMLDRFMKDHPQNLESDQLPVVNQFGPPKVEK